MAFQSLKNFTRTLTSLVNHNQRQWDGKPFQTFPLVTATEEDASKLSANLTTIPVYVQILKK